jgi:hypothetical protein
MERIINLMEIVEGTSTNEQGWVLYTLIAQQLKSGHLIKLSLREATPMSSSFLNSSSWKTS